MREARMRGRGILDDVKPSHHMRRRAKGLRKRLTLSERRLWNWLRGRTFGGVKFRRQVPIGRYVIDFYCPELKLAIEIDGRHHETEWMSEYDGKRAAYLRSRGVEVVRITNEQIAKDSDIAEEIIRAAIDHASS